MCGGRAAKRVGCNTNCAVHQPVLTCPLHNTLWSFWSAKIPISHALHLVWGILTLSYDSGLSNQNTVFPVQCRSVRTGVIRSCLRIGTEGRKKREGGWNKRGNKGRSKQVSKIERKKRKQEGEIIKLGDM